MAHSFVDSIGDVDVISDAEVNDTLFQSSNFQFLSAVNPRCYQFLLLYMYESGDRSVEVEPITIRLPAGITKLEETHGGFAI